MREINEMTVSIEKKLIFPAFAASVVVPATIYMVIVTILDDGMRTWWSIILPAVLLVAFGHALLLGLPCVLLLLRGGRFRLWTLALTGFLVGSIPSAIGVLLRNPQVVLSEPKDTLLAILGLGLIGLLGGVTFFWVWNLQSGAVKSQ